MSSSCNVSGILDILFLVFVRIDLFHRQMCVMSLILVLDMVCAYGTEYTSDLGVLLPSSDELIQLTGAYSYE